MSQYNKESLTLSPDEIMSITPRELLLHVVRGVKQEYNFIIGIMLNVPQPDPKLSQQTGYEFIYDPNVFRDLCMFLRLHENPQIAKRCVNCDLNHFVSCRLEVNKNHNYKGTHYFCDSIQLIDFVVPIYEPISSTFIGVIFGGQRRPKESIWQTYKRLYAFLRTKDNKLILKFRRQIIKKYRKVEQADNYELDQMMETCRGIATDLQQMYGYHAKLKKQKIERQIRENSVLSIHQELISAISLEKYWNSMQSIVENLHNWVPFDWCIVFNCEEYQQKENSLKISAYHGLGLPKTHEIESAISKWTALRDDVKPMQKDKLAHSCIMAVMQQFLGSEAKFYDHILRNQDQKCIGVLIFGSAPNSPKSQFDDSTIAQRSSRIDEIITAMIMEYQIIEGLEKARNTAQTLEQLSRDQQILIDQLRNTLLSLNHQLHRPLFLVRGALGNVRNHMKSVKDSSLFDQINLGMEVAMHSALLCRGLATALAIEDKAESKPALEPIDIRFELQKLAHGMAKVMDKESQRFKFFDESPKILMDKWSFLFVFYTLIDNALKYTHDDERIDFDCSYERTTKSYALKVKSRGQSIHPRDIENVFIKFWRDPRSKHVDELGLGFGCWAAREHMIKCEGKLELEVDGDLSIFIVVPPIMNKFINIQGKETSP